MKHIAGLGLLAIALLIIGCDLHAFDALGFLKKNKVDRKGERQGLWVYYRDDAHKYIESKGYFRHGIAVKKWKYFSEFGTYKKRKIQPRPYLHLYKNILP